MKYRLFFLAIFTNLKKKKLDADLLSVSDAKPRDDPEITICTVCRPPKGLDCDCPPPEDHQVLTTTISPNADTEQFAPCDGNSECN